MLAKCLFQIPKYVSNRAKKRSIHLKLSHVLQIQQFHTSKICKPPAPWAKFVIVKSDLGIHFLKILNLKQMIISSVNTQMFRKPLNKSLYRPFLEEYFQRERLQTGINVPTLSALVNKEYGMNFNDFVNQYRVAYFKDLIRKPEYHQWTLEAIANKAGFNSRTTFIRAFTKFAECSPSEYLRFVKLNLMVA
jgi:AraC-like DNA-binding protein